MAERDFDAIIVGGRVAGATLAMRLAQLRMRVLLLERATAPFPRPISCPAIFGSSMVLLDELGMAEHEYAPGHPRVYRAGLEFGGGYERVAYFKMHLGRNYCYGIDREIFDRALWARVAATPGVTARDSFAVSALLRDGEAVTGVRGRARGGAEEEFSAAVVIGADGRFSRVAQQAGAEVTEEEDVAPSSLLFAYWEDAAPYDNEGPSSNVFIPRQGLLVNMIETSGNRLMVATQGRTDLFTPNAGESAEDIYESLLAKEPQRGSRLTGARRVSNVLGLRHIQNLYRVPGGPGWVLVGDAFHQKDPLDAQGVYDALMGAKLLALALGAWWQGTMSWRDALAWYEDEVRRDTHPMFKATIGRAMREFYWPVPQRVWRWLANHPEAGDRFLGLLSRRLDPEHWFPLGTVVEAVIQGAANDAFDWLSNRPEPEPAAGPVLDDDWYEAVAREAATAFTRQVR